MAHFRLRYKTQLPTLFFIAIIILTWTSYKLIQLNGYKSREAYRPAVDQNIFQGHFDKSMLFDQPTLQPRGTQAAGSKPVHSPQVGPSRKSIARGLSKEMKIAIKQFANTLVFCKGVPGLTVGVVKEDDYWTMPVGVRNINSGSRVTEKTKFLIGSITKTFHAQLVAKTIQDSKGRLTWDSLLSDMVGPDIVLVSDDFDRNATIRDILSHRSGLVSGNLAVRALLPPNITREEILKLSKHIPRNSLVGEKFLYSNMAYTLLGAALEHWWKRPWEELIQEKLFQPLGMDTAEVVRDGKSMIADDFAKPYVPVEGDIKECDPQIYELGSMAVTGNIVASAEDMITWMQFLLAGGKGTDNHILEPELLSDMWEPQIQLSPNFKARTEKKRSSGWPEDDINTGYGMGWFLNNYKGLRNYWHGGGLYSYYSLAWLLPQVKIGIFISINGYQGCSNDTNAQHSGFTKSCLCGSNGFGIVESLAYFITDTLLQHDQWINESTACSYPYPWVKCSGSNKITLAHEEAPVMNLTSYTGEYINALLGKVYIWEETSQLHFALRNLTGLLTFHSIDGFKKVTFGLECTGRYRFISKPDRVPYIDAKPAFFLIFNADFHDNIESVYIHYSIGEVPFLFNKALDKG